MKSLLVGVGCASALLLQHALAFAPASYTHLTSSHFSIWSKRDNNSSTSGSLHARPQTRFREVQGNILTRRTINDFEPNLPSHWERALERAIEAAIYAPNHKRTEPWRFYLLGRQSIERVCRHNSETVTAKKGEAAGAKKFDRWMAMPGWLVVTCVKTDDGDEDKSSMEDPAGVGREDYAAVCCAVQNLCLSLQSQGLGTKWTTGPVNFSEGFADAVGFDYEEEYTVGTIWFGTPADRPNPPKKKMGLDEVLVKTD
mmetsp:Transcript_20064/g.34530  ORF Transcript_20064/g.34530 Transcript_20064/m.34530 type:complete len:256 (-) Transcript_20064:305-1072(-)